MIIGIDEVGRGPVAGPVCLCAFLFHGSPSKLRLSLDKEKIKQKIILADSKKLSASQREVWAMTMRKWKREGKCDFAYTFVHAKTIDRIGIAPAIKKAIALSLQKVTDSKVSRGGKRATNITVLLDGGLKAPLHFKKQKTIIKGDEKESIIALASIVAKVARDRYMKRLSKKHLHYGFEQHVGYGTRSHYAAIRKHGLSPQHRTSFLKAFSA